MKKILQFLNILDLKKEYRQNVLKLPKFRHQPFINSTKKSNFYSSWFLLDCYSYKMPVKVAPVYIFQPQVRAMICVFPQHYGN